MSFALPLNLEQLLQSNLSFLVVGVVGLAIIGLILFRFVKNGRGANAFKAELVEKRQLTHDTIVFTFLLPPNRKTIGLKVGEHLQISANISGEQVKRKYTPISRTDRVGSFQLLIKIYRKCTEFPEGGKMSQYLDNLKIKDSINVTLPYGRFNYRGNGQISIRDVGIKHYKNIYMVGGGTGITPLYQIIQYVTESESQSQKAPNINLLYANRTEKDILLQSELRNYAKQNSKFKVFFSVDKSVTSEWNQLVGFVDKEKLAKTMPEDRENTLFVSCGPPILCNNFEKFLIKDFNIPYGQIFRF